MLAVMGLAIAWLRKRHPRVVQAWRFSAVGVTPLPSRPDEADETSLTPGIVRAATLAACVAFVGFMSTFIVTKELAHVTVKAEDRPMDEELL